MNDPSPHSTLREWRSAVTRPTAAAAFVGVAGLLALVGPFGTDETLRLAPRFGYWLVVALATWSAGFVVTQATLRGLSRHLPPAPARGLAALACGLAVVLVVLALNAAIFGRLPGRDSLPVFALTVFLVAVIVTGLLFLLNAQPRAETAGVAAAGATGSAHDAPSRAPAPVPAPSKAAPAPAAPALLQRLALDKRGALVSLRVEDHYVHVQTTAGSAMVLMRLGDAIAETAPADGLQVHRSYWVAREQVTAATRDGDRAVLQMTHGPDVPVSRRYLPAIRKAGLLPR